MDDEAILTEEYDPTPKNLQLQTLQGKTYCGECIRDSRTSVPLPLDDDAAETEKCSDDSADVRGTTQFAPDEENEGGHS